MKHILNSKHWPFGGRVENLTLWILEAQLHDAGSDGVAQVVECLPTNYMLLCHRTLWVKMNGERNPVNQTLNSKNWTLFKRVSLLTNLVLELQLHASLSYSIIEHYEQKWMWPKFLIDDRWREILPTTYLILTIEHCARQATLKQNWLYHGNYMLLCHRP
jgi:hypothetical protein